MNPDLPANESISSIFQENVIIRGDLELSQPLLLDGKLYGNIHSKSHVIVGEKGYVEGQIKADKVTMWGKIKGNIFSHTLCILQDVASVDGDITSAKLAMKEGACFNGNAKIQTPPKEQEKPQPLPVVNRLKQGENSKVTGLGDELDANLKMNKEF